MTYIAPPKTQANVKIYLYSGSSRSSCDKLENSSLDFVISGGQSKYIEATAKTAYFKAGAKVNGNTFDNASGTKLFNKSGVIYPTYTNSDCGVTVPEPSLNWNKTTSISWTSSDRTKYLKWFEQTYLNGKTQNWDNWQVHHMRPRTYGGQNNYSNLIPMPETKHREFTSWFAGY